MSAFFVAMGVLLFQVAFSWGVIQASAGNGSFVGLGALLLALPGIPATALVNFLVLRGHRSDSASPSLLRLATISLILPALQLALLVVVSALGW
jgi:hypothetical protein